MSQVPIQTADEWWCASQHASVEHRGAAMGKVYVHREGEQPGPDTVEAVLLWTGNARISVQGIIEPTREQKNRAIRALAESPWGEMALGRKFDPKDWAVAPVCVFAGCTKPAMEGAATCDEHTKPMESLDDVWAKTTAPALRRNFRVLDDLRDRLEKANTTLMDMAEQETLMKDEARAAHLRSKAEGVRLALSYLREMMVE